ncbi:hypothetical protein Tco_0187627, partial [Tanacetum coccineum]
KTQRQSWNKDSRLDDLRRNEAHKALLDVCGVSSAPKRSTVIRFRIPQRRSTRLTPPSPIPTVDKADEMILQDILQVSLAEHKSREEQEARENVELVNKHLASVEIEKMMEGWLVVFTLMFPGRLSPTRLEWTIDTIEDLSLKEGINLRS